MFKKAIRFSIFVAAVLLLVVSVQCQSFGAFTWASGYSEGDDIKIKYSNYENLLVGAVGEELFGVAYITDIVNESTGLTMWQDVATDGGEITAVFSNYILRNAIPLAGGKFDFYFDGGNLDFYYDGTPDTPGAIRANPAMGSGATLLTPDVSGNWTNGTPWLSLTGTSGYVGANEAGGSDLLYDESNATLYAAMNALTGFIDNAGNGLFDVNSVGAIAEDFLNSNVGWFSNPAADIWLKSHLTDKTGKVPSGSYPVRSEDPLYATATPEPASLVIWGLLTLGMIVLYRRR